MFTPSTVQSFGSEDRVTPHGAPIPASDQIYEFIVFQAAQIKDLVVAPNAPPPVDPAILQAVSQPARNARYVPLRLADIETLFTVYMA